MEYQENKFLGLTKKQSLFGFLLMAVVHTFTSAYSVYSNATIEQLKKMPTDEVENFYVWYIYYPTLFLSFFFLSRFSDYMLKDIKFKQVLGFILSLVIGILTIVSFKILFLIILYWNQI